MNELVFIGQNIDPQQVITGLEARLLQPGKHELFDEPQILRDPFPKNI